MTKTAHDLHNEFKSKYELFNDDSNDLLIIITILFFIITLPIYLSGYSPDVGGLHMNLINVNIKHVCSHKGFEYALIGYPVYSNYINNNTVYKIKT